jgi:hypothetical protein
MIYGIFHPGSGLGNQLHRYVATRVLALDKSYDFSIINAGGFKGYRFMKLDMGIPNDMDFTIEEPAQKVIPYTPLRQWNEWNKEVYDPDFNFVEDHTIIDGNFEDPKYFEHRLPEIKEWLKTEPLDIEDDVCVIGFRGGEYYTVPELGLPKEYYDRAIEIMKSKGITKFEVHTDDPELARQFFPDYKITRDISLNWRAVRYAKYAIIANSSFYVLPRLLNGGLTIAPRYWSRYNTKKWDYPQNYYSCFSYI